MDNQGYAVRENSIPISIMHRNQLKRKPQARKSNR